uniref:Uncharacterized protein n=1 Tax=Sphaerodactylus townsendi TaxID=933632 RepID=A0ACB8GAU2_9SAUR
MDRRLQRLEEEVSQLGARVRALEDPGQPGSQTPMVAERESSGSSQDRLQIVTSEEEASDTTQRPPTSDPSAVVIVPFSSGVIPPSLLMSNHNVLLAFHFCEEWRRPHLKFWCDVPTGPTNVVEHNAGPNKCRHTVQFYW